MAAATGVALAPAGAFAPVSVGRGAQALRTRIDAARETPKTLEWLVKITLLLSVSK